ncbi:MAG: hypothetical protein ACE5E6_11110 [Phycisphaerae bacterium]
MTRTRPAHAFMLIHMLAVLVLAGVGLSVATVGLAGMINAQNQVARLSNRYTVLNDVLNHLRKDVRGAQTLTLRRGDETPSAYVLELHGRAASTRRPAPDPANHPERRAKRDDHQQRDTTPDTDRIAHPRWRFDGRHVERIAPTAHRDAAHRDADKHWDLGTTDVVLQLMSPKRPDITAGGTLLDMTITWRPESNTDPSPTRRFHLTIRCTEEVRRERP